MEDAAAKPHVVRADVPPMKRSGVSWRLAGARTVGARAAEGFEG